MELVFEIITRNGKVLSLHSVEGERISIGRAYDNHLILQEEHICPLHAELYQDENGDLILEDAASVNGIKNRFNRPLGNKVKVNSGDEFVMGKFHLRIFRPDHPVIEAKKLNIFEDIARGVNHWYWALSTLMVFFLWMLLDDYLSSYKEIVWSQLTVKTLVATLGLAIVPLVVALAARIFRKDVKFFTIVVFCFAILIAWQILASLGSFLLFNWGGSALVGLGQQIVEYGLLAVFLWGCFYLASNMSLKKITYVSSTLVLVVASLFYLYGKGDDKVVLSPVFLAKVLPTSLLVASPMTVDAYTDASQALFSRATEEAERRNKEADEQSGP